MGSKSLSNINDEALALPPQPACQSLPSLTTGGLQNLPVYLIHGVAASPEPAVAAVAHKGQDGVSVCDSLHHGLQVQQAAVGHGYHCKKGERVRSSLGAPQSQG